MALRDAWTALLRRETKSSRAGPLVALQHPGRAVWSARRFDAFAEEAYQKNVIAFRAINQVSRAAASVPWRLAQGVTRGGRPLGRPGERPGGRPGGRATGRQPLLDLLARPNPMMAGSEFIEAVTGYYLIAGNAYVEAVGVEAGGLDAPGAEMGGIGAPGAELGGMGDGPPRELWPLRPDRMKVIAGKTGLPQGYAYTLAGAERRWDADPVTGKSPILHLKTFHPLDDWYGLSPVEPAGFAIDQRNESDRWNMALLQNGARPSGALVYEPRDGAAANLTDEQFARLRQEVAAQYGGAKNAGRPMLLDGGLRWQEMSLSPKDMDFLNARHAASRDVAQAFGVPSQLLGIPGDNTYSNYQEARLALWEETVIPLLRHLRDEFNAWLAPRFGEDVALDIDLDEIPALTLRRERVWARLQDAEFLTVNEKRAQAGLPPHDDGDRLPSPSDKRPATTKPRDRG